ncbi:MAG TPA: hypothetical protein VFA71_01410 [Terriglobales bacterium]|nr:hypothetical protein [Terriglobales bacterium]
MKSILILLLLLATGLFAQDLKLNPHLDYDSDSQDGALITGSNASGGLVKDKVNYVFMFEEG